MALNSLGSVRSPTVNNQLLRFLKCNQTWLNNNMDRNDHKWNVSHMTDLSSNSIHWLVNVRPSPTNIAAISNCNVIIILTLYRNFMVIRVGKMSSISIRNSSHREMSLLTWLANNDRCDVHGGRGKEGGKATTIWFMRRESALNLLNIIGINGRMRAPDERNEDESKKQLRRRQWVQKRSPPQHGNTLSLSGVGQ